MSNSYFIMKLVVLVKFVIVLSVFVIVLYMVLNWVFLFLLVGKDDLVNLMIYMKVLVFVEDGFYLLGVNGMWYGGIYFD